MKDDILEAEEQHRKVAALMREGRPQTKLQMNAQLVRRKQHMGRGSSWGLDSINTHHSH